MGSGTASPASSDGVALTESDGYFVATDEKTGVSSQGATKAEALENLAEALRLHDRSVLDADDVNDQSSAPWF